MSIECLKVGDLPENFKEVVIRTFIDYSVTLGRTKSGKAKDFIPLGSGVLVKGGNHFGILTARHCLHACMPEVQLGLNEGDTLRAVPLQKILKRHFGVPVFINNDANCFALGELHFGVGRGCQNLVGLIVGTGLGAGVVINGRLYSGSNGGAGEIGAIAYREKDFEYYCSGRFFEREFGLDGATLQQRAGSGDRKAQAMLAAFGDDFANVIMALLYAYDPEIIVLGGSVIKAYPYYEKRMREKLKGFHFQNSLKKLVMAQTQKPNIAVLAATALCLDNQ